MGLMDQTYDTRKPYSLSCWLWIADKQCHILSPIKDDAPKGKAVTLQQIVDYYDAIHPEQQYVINYNCVQIYSSFIPPSPTPKQNKEESKGNIEIQLSLF